MKSVTFFSFTAGCRHLVFAALALLLSACATSGGPGNEPGSRSADEFVNAPDAQPRDEPIVALSTRPYTVFGKRYYPLKQRQPIVQTGEASWYGRQFHGRPTSIGETYDMYGMTAAHPTLPLPSYVRVTNLANQRTAVVRVNDRGPFLNDRIIDLSFAAAAKLGYTEQSTAQVRVEVVDPVVVTLQALRKRRGLPATASAEKLAAAARTDEKVIPLQAAAQMPLIKPDAGQSPAATSAGRTGNVPEIASAASRAAAATAGVSAGVSDTPQGALPAVLLPSPGSGEPSAALPEKVSAQPQQVQSLELDGRRNRQVADVFIPPDVSNNRVAPLPVSEPPAIQVEALQASKLRRAVPERIRKRSEPKRNTRLASKDQDEPVFVVPYKDRLKKEVRAPEPPPRVYLQLGAYDTEKSARVAMVEVEMALQWLGQPVAIISERGRHKIQAGPFATAKRAQAAARRIRSASSFSPFYVFR